MGGDQSKTIQMENVGRVVITLDKRQFNINDPITGEIQLFIDKFIEIKQKNISLIVQLMQSEKLNYKQQIKKKADQVIQTINIDLGKWSKELNLSLFKFQFDNKILKGDFLIQKIEGNKKFLSCKLSYISAVIKFNEKSIKDIKSIQNFKVKQKYDPKKIVTSFNYNFSHGNILLFCLGQTTIKAQLDKNQYYFGEQMKIHLKFENKHSNINLQFVDVNLYEVRNLVNETKRQLQEIEQVVVSRSRIEQCKKNDDFDKDVLLAVPKEFNLSVNGMLMNIYYKIEIVCFFSNNCLQKKTLKYTISPIYIIEQS